jgi:hypothetical protein
MAASGSQELFQRVIKLAAIAPQSITLRGVPVAVVVSKDIPGLKFFNPLEN